MNTKADREEQLTLEVLRAVNRRSDLSQRHLSRQLGVALGLTNSYLKRCIRKGWVKISEAPANRYLYYLTPKGLSEKSRLTARYLSTSFVFYREAGRSYHALFEACAQKRWHRVLLCGVSELAEIAVLRASDASVDVVGVYDLYSGRRSVAGKPVWRAFNADGRHDVCVITDLHAPLATYEHVVKLAGREHVLVPDILDITPGE